MALTKRRTFSERIATPTAGRSETNRKRRTRSLVVPRYVTPDPPNVVGTYGDRVVAWAARELSLQLDAWQAWSIRQLLRHDRRGDLIHRVALLSTGRQNGKSVIVRCIFGWLLDEGHRIEPFSSWTELLAAAHDAKQARLLYLGVYRDLLSIDRLAQLYRDSGRFDRSVRLTEHFGIELDGLLLDTVTGQPGSSRGHTAGAIAWDEVLTQTDHDGYAALSPTQAAQRSPLLLLTSTAGFANSVVLRQFFDRLVRIDSGAERPDPTFFGAWWQSVNGDAAADDWEAISQANPSLGDRLTRSYVAAEARNLPPDHFKRERLNHWVDAIADAAIAPHAWAACRTPTPLAGVSGPFALGVDAAIGMTRGTVAVAAQRSDGRIGVEIFRDIRPTGSELVSAARLLEAVHAFSDPLQRVAYDGVLGVASAFDRDSQESYLPWDGLTAGQMVAASMDVSEMIAAGRLAIDDPLLDAQMPNVTKRMIGNEGAFRFSRGLSNGPIDAFLAMTLAAHAVAYSQQLPQIF